MDKNEETLQTDDSVTEEDAAKFTPYINCMEEIKLRHKAIWAMQNRAITKTTTAFRATNIEFQCLQVRKILELIALASLSANKDEYAKQHANFNKHWKAKKILESIEKINPEFYPTPLARKNESKTGRIEVEMKTSGFLTREEFSDVYDDCSQLMHASNPYGPAINYAKTEKQIPEWVEKIKNLLDHHMVLLVNQNKNQKPLSLWVVMSAEKGAVKGTIFQKVG